MKSKIKKLICCSLIILFPFIVSAQEVVNKGKLVVLHPSVDSIITIDKKIKYALFPEYTNSVFGSAELIKYNDTVFSFVFKTTNGSTFERATTRTDIDKMYYQIEERDKNDVASNQKCSDSYVETDEDKTNEKSRKHSHWHFDPNPDTINLYVNLTFITLEVLSIFAHR